MKLTHLKKPIKMHNIENTLKIGSHEDGGLNLMCKVYLNDKKIQEFKGHSFLQGFAYGLHSQIHGGNANRFWGGLYTTNIGALGFSITSISTGSPVTVDVSPSNLNSIMDNGYVWVHGVRGTMKDAVNGLKRMRYVDTNTLRLYELDNTTPVNGAGLTYGGNGWLSIHDYRTDGINPNGYYFNTLSSWDLIIGRDNTLIDIEQFGLLDGIGQGSALDSMSVTTTQISTQTTNKPSSRFVVSRSFTNASGSTINVGEIGIVSQYLGSYQSNNPAYYITLLARDILPSPVSVPNTGTLTIEYEVITNLVPDTQDTETDGTNGGFVDDFLTTLRNLATLSTGSSEYKKLYNSAGGCGNNSATNTTVISQYTRGIRVGTDQTFTSMTDENLLGVINHGEADGELYHYGNNVEDNVEIDTLNQKAVITMNRIFENRGSIPITIKEIGWYGNSDNSGSEYNGNMFARTALKSTDWYTVQPGDFVMITYKIEIIA